MGLGLTAALAAGLAPPPPAAENRLEANLRDPRVGIKAADLPAEGYAIGLRQPRRQARHRDRRLAGVRAGARLI